MPLRELKTERLNLVVTPSDARTWRAAADAQDMSLSDLVRRAMRSSELVTKKRAAR